jgi:hypothetical protein
VACPSLHIRWIHEVQNQQPIQQNNTPNHGTFKGGLGSQGNVFAKRLKKESHHNKGSTSNVCVKPNGNRKRKNVVESGESIIYVGNNFDYEDDTISNDNGFPSVLTSRDERPCRSTRQKLVF